MRGVLVGVVILSVGCESLVGVEPERSEDPDASSSGVGGGGASAGSAGVGSNVGSGATSAGRGGSGTAGAGGSAGTAGTGGSAGTAGTGGSGGTAGRGGSAGTAGTVGSGGTAGAGGDAGTTVPDSGPDTGDAPASDAPPPPTIRTYSAAQDTQIQEVYPTTNFGNNTTCNAHGDPQERACLFMWNIADIPSNSRVTSATVTLQITHPTTEVSSVYGVFAVRVPWTESEATWEERQTGRAWSTPGAKPPDRGPQMATLAGKIGSYSIALSTEEVQGWVSDPSRNLGIIIANPSAPTSMSIATSEYEITEYRPTLTVTFVKP